jgi:hypothetical protein
MRHSLTSELLTQLQGKERLHLPMPSLHGCIRGFMTRDTRGILLSDQQRFSYYPATPLCTISWWFSGTAEQVLTDSFGKLGQNLRLPGPVIFSGPQSQPVANWSDGMGHGMMLLLLPDAVELMTGMSPSKFLNQHVAVRSVFPSDWVAMTETVLALNDDRNKVEAIQAFIDPIWRSCKPKQYADSQRFKD